MNIDKYLISEANYKEGDWIVQRARSFTTWAKVLGMQKNKSYKVVAVMEEAGKFWNAKIASTKGWHPSPESIPESEVPKEAIAKVQKKMSRM